MSSLKALYYGNYVIEMSPHLTNPHYTNIFFAKNTACFVLQIFCMQFRSIATLFRRGDGVAASATVHRCSVAHLRMHFVARMLQDKCELGFVGLFYLLKAL